MEEERRQMDEERRQMDEERREMILERSQMADEVMALRIDSPWSRTTFGGSSPDAIPVR